MKYRKWKDKPFAVVRPRRGQKYRMAQLCAVLSRGDSPSVEMLSDVFGVSAGLIYQARAAAGPAKHGNGHARPAKSNGHSVTAIREPELPLVMPTPVEITRITDPWLIAEALVREQGVETAFDKLIVPRL